MPASSWARGVSRSTSAASSSTSRGIWTSCRREGRPTHDASVPGVRVCVRDHRRPDRTAGEARSRPPYGTVWVRCAHTSPAFSKTLPFLEESSAWPALAVTSGLELLERPEQVGGVIINAESTSTVRVMCVHGCFINYPGEEERHDRVKHTEGFCQRSQTGGWATLPSHRDLAKLSC